MEDMEDRRRDTLSWLGLARLGTAQRSQMADRGYRGVQLVRGSGTCPRYTKLSVPTRLASLKPDYKN